MNTSYLELTGLAGYDMLMKKYNILKSGIRSSTHTAYGLYGRCKEILINDYKKKKEMRFMKKVLFSAALTLCLLLGINTMTMAAACTCGNNRPHDSGSHNTYCENTGNAQGHQVFCYTCQVNGHDDTCAQVDLGIKAHSWGNPEGIGTSRKHSCTECGYTEKLSCNHAQTNWNNNGDGTCSQYCRDCQSVLTTKSHDIKYTVSSVSETELHYADCTRCSYSKTEYHVWKTTYTPYPTPKNPIMKSKNVLTWPTRDHKTVHTCKLCGESWEEKLNTITLPGKGHLYEHKWRNNKCTRCGLKRYPSNC